MAQDDKPTTDEERRDAVLRRMLATPKAVKGQAGVAASSLAPSTPDDSGCVVGGRDLCEEVPEPLRLIMEENTRALASLPR